MQENLVLGVDVGASGIKGSIVDINAGELVSERLRLPTPKPSLPETMAETFQILVNELNWSGPVGCGFPAIVKNGVALSAANISKQWIGRDVSGLFSQSTGLPVYVVNDADAAGVAEMVHGAGKGKQGVVILITIGSGLGSALFIDGKLVPNTELGHLFLRNMVAEHYASNSARKNFDLSWEVWGRRFNEYLQHLERLFVPDMLILSGGISKRFKNYEQFLNTEAPVVPAHLLNNAGIVGAALNAKLVMEKTSY